MIKYLPYKCLGYLEGAKEICTFFFYAKSFNFCVRKDFHLPNDGKVYKTSGFREREPDLYLIVDDKGNIRGINDFKNVLRGKAPRKRRCYVSKSWKDQSKRRHLWEGGDK